MPFSKPIKRDALIRSRRHCCICHEFSGLYTDVHHIEQEADGGPNTIGNAITLCLECHGQAGHYNPRHPIGNKYSPEELVRHRDEWWSWCQNNPFSPLPTDPIKISPTVISIPHIAPIVGPTNIPIDLEVKNTSEKDIYSIWVMLSTSEIDLEGVSIEIEGSEKIGELHPKYIEQETGTVTLKMESKGTSLPNYDFSKTSVYIKSKEQPKVSYIGISKLSPNEVRTIGITIKNIKVSKKQNIPLRVDLFSEEACTWLIEEGNSFVINFSLPDGVMFHKGLSEFRLINMVSRVQL